MRHRLARLDKIIRRIWLAVLRIGRSRETSLEDTAIVPGRGDGGLDQDGSDGCGEVWLNSVFTEKENRIC